MVGILVKQNQILASSLLSQHKELLDRIYPVDMGGLEKEKSELEYDLDLLKEDGQLTQEQIEEYLRDFDPDYGD